MIFVVTNDENDRSNKAPKKPFSGTARTSCVSLAECMGD